MKKTLITLISLISCAVGAETTSFSVTKDISLNTEATKVIANTTDTINPWESLSWGNSGNFDKVVKNSPSILDEGWHYFSSNGGDTAQYELKNGVQTFSRGTDGNGAHLTYTISALHLLSESYPSENQTITNLTLTTSKGQCWDLQWGVYVANDENVITKLASFDNGSNNLSGGNETSKTMTLNGINISSTDKIIVMYRTGSNTGLSQITQLSMTTKGTALIPEPATATLSLLALAGLAARRRRR